MSTATSRTIEVPGGSVVYDVAADEASAKRPLMFIGHPMGAGGFQQLAGHFGDRTLITYDPRGAERGKKDDPSAVAPPDVHADDLHRVIQEAAGGGPVDMFASSGGAINALALVARYPNDVRTLVAHEPPLASALPDAEHAAAAVRAIHETYMRSGFGAGMAHFIAITGHQGLMTAETATQPPPDPQMFGMPAADDGNRTDPLLGPSMVAITTYQPDWDAIRAAPTHVVLGAGQTSEGQMANRGAHAVAQKLGAQLVTFPGGHGGFNNSEWEPADPEAFAQTLRQVLDS